MTNKEELIKAAETFINCCNEHYLFKCPNCPLLVTCGELNTELSLPMRRLINRLRLSHD